MRVLKNDHLVDLESLVNVPNLFQFREVHF